MIMIMMSVADLCYDLIGFLPSRSLAQLDVVLDDQDVHLVLDPMTVSKEAVLLGFEESQA